MEQEAQLEQGATQEVLSQLGDGASSAAAQVEAAPHTPSIPS